MSMKTISAGLAIAAAAIVAACTETPKTDTADLSRRAITATIAAIPDTPENGVAVADVVRTPTTTSWRATIDTSNYACTADELMRVPDCKKIES